MKSALIKGIKQIVLPFRRGKFHNHIKVRTFMLQSPAPASGHSNIHNRCINVILINLCLHMAFHSFLDFFRIHFTNIME